MGELATRSLVGTGLIVVAVLALWAGGWAFGLLVALAAVAMLVEWHGLTRRRGLHWLAIGIVYIASSAAALTWLRSLDDGAIVLWVFIVTWATDILAYFTGRSFGGPKLAPSISPGKTWSGLIGGVIGASIGGGLVVHLCGLATGLLLLAPLLAVAAQCGDLFESSLKRRAGVKDSGKLLPGHGGVLDRLDGLLPVALLTGLAYFSGWIAV
nr:phosphatidate cytidylyltransferase [Sphingomonas formosensis]